MKRKIFWGMLTCALTSALIVTIAFAFLFASRMQTDIKESLTRARVTLVAVDGTVTFDNQSRTNTMDNHLDRPEIQAALANGQATIERYSDTLGQTLYYTAMRLPGGEVLRLALSQSNIARYSGGVLWVLVLVLCGALVMVWWFAKRLTRRIIAPINAGNVKAYDELSPYARLIADQAQDIDRKMQEITVRADTLSAITAGMQEGLLLLAQNETLLLCNDSAQRMLGINRSPVGRLLGECTRVLPILEAAKIALSGQNTHIQIQRDGRVYQLFAHPAPQGALLLFLDVTAVAHAEAMRQAFTANVSHELKTPLTVVSGYAEMMASGMVAVEDIPHSAFKIQEESARLLHLIDDILSLSKLDERTEGMETAWVDLSTIATQVLARLAPLADQHQVTLDVSLQPCPLSGNAALLSEMVANLVTNGIQYNRVGGRVDITLSKDTLTVSDTGIGIPEADLPRICERFYRVDPSRSKKTGGTGLGLAIVKHVVQWHGGSLQINSHVGEGTTVTIKLPLGNPSNPSTR